MGRYMIKKYKPVVEYHMGDRYHDAVTMPGYRMFKNYAHIQVLMNNTTLFYLAFRFGKTWPRT